MNDCWKITIRSKRSEILGNKHFDYQMIDKNAIKFEFATNLRNQTELIKNERIISLTINLFTICEKIDKLTVNDEFMGNICFDGIQQIL